MLLAYVCLAWLVQVQFEVRAQIPDGYPSPHVRPPKQKEIEPTHSIYQSSHFCGTVNCIIITSLIFNHESMHI